MTTITFDTHEFVRKLRESGMPEEQAEAVCEAVKTASAQADVVTKPYLDIKLETLKADMVKWIAGMLLAQAGLVAALVKLL